MRTAGKGRRTGSWAEPHCALAVVVSMCGSLLAAAEPNATVRVRVYNYAELSQGVLVSAEKEASRIFADAGVDTLWADCSTTGTQVQSVSVPSGQVQEEKRDCGGPVTGAMVDLRILARSIAADPALDDATFGFADGPSMASVLYGRVEELTLRVDGDERRAPVILGAVIAHELGHSLLGTASHSSRGIMRANWDPVFLRQVLWGHEMFSAEQSALIRATVIRRQHENIQP